MRSKRLTRQIKKALGTESPDQIESIKNTEFAQQLETLFQSIDEAYVQLEERESMAKRNMEVSGRELTEANSRLITMNQTFDAMVNCLGQGFLLVGKDGICQSTYSKACEVLLETQPAGRPLAEVLKIPEAKRSTFHDWLDILFRDVMDFSDFSSLGPDSVAHSAGRTIELEYKPVRDRQGLIEFIMVIATDISKETLAHRRAENLETQAAFITNVVKDKERFRQFIFEFRSAIEECQELIALGIETEFLLGIKQRLHGIKGSAGTFGMMGVQQKASDFESKLAAMASNSMKAAPAELRELLSQELTDLNQVCDETLQQNSELVAEVLASDEPHREIPLSELRQFAERLLGLPATHSHMHVEFNDAFVALPMTKILGRYNIVLQQMARRFNKKIQLLRFTGDDPHLVPEEFGRLWSDLEHLFRNIGDHGIEAPELRIASGKPEFGCVDVHLKVTSGRVHVQIRDDGAGIDQNRLSSIISRFKLAPEISEIISKNPLEAIFLPGLSTAQQMTQISGRGIGLSAVRSSVEELGGQIDVKSEFGVGTEFHIQLPLSRITPSVSI